MPGNKDAKRRTEIVNQSQKKIYGLRLTVAVRNDSGLIKPLSSVVVDRTKNTQEKYTIQQYMIEATREKLIRDGYMSGEEE